MNQPETRTIVDSRGRKRVLVVTSCSCCRRCWLFADTGHCIYDGPFTRYRREP